MNSSSLDSILQLRLLTSPNGFIQKSSVFVATADRSPSCLQMLVCDGGERAFFCLGLPAGAAAT